MYEQPSSYSSQLSHERSNNSQLLGGSSGAFSWDASRGSPSGSSSAPSVAESIRFLRSLEDVRARIRSGTGITKRRQGIFWILTIPHEHFTPWLPAHCSWIKGQLEKASSGFLHWQVVVGLKTKGSVGSVRSIFGPFHAELTRSSSANAYVWKAETAVPGTQFEIGAKPCNPSEKTDW